MTYSIIGGLIAIWLILSDLREVITKLHSIERRLDELQADLRPSFLGKMIAFEDSLREEEGEI